ncbi:MAG: hypothetical protein AAFU49_17950 [Pseudomonadota bacterium]
MKLSDLDWSEPETGGSLKSAYTVADARFTYKDERFVAVEWFHRTGGLLKSYSSLILIAEECDKTGDGQLLRSIAFGAAGQAADGVPHSVYSQTLKRQVIVINDPTDREIALGSALDEIL